MKLKNKLLLVLLIFTVALQLNAQNTHVIVGIVADSDGNPLPSASAALHLKSDSSFVAGDKTDPNGKLQLKVKPGEYFLKISYLSYKTEFVEVSLKNKALGLGTIKLLQSSTMTDEVVVEGEKAQVELDLDKRVFNVGQDLRNRGKNASDIIENLPSVNIDQDGNISLRGSENVNILIDGKQSALIGRGDEDALRQLQGSMIEKIEIITNPSARYDAEGEVGIINIVLKKEKRKGFNGTFGVTAGNPEDYGANFDVNFRSGLVNFFAGYGIQYEKNPGEGFMKQTFTGNESLSYYERDYDRERGGLGNNLRFGSDFFLSETNILTASLIYGYNEDNNTALLTYRDYDTADNLLSTTVRDDDEDETEHEIEAALGYRKDFSRKGHLFTADIKLINNDDTEISNILETGVGNNIEQDPLEQRSSNTEDERTWLIQADYIHPFNKESKFEAGLKSNLRNIENFFTVEEMNDAGEWDILQSFNDNFMYTENISAAYMIYGSKFGKLSYQGGLRAEYSDITTELTESNTINHRDYLDLFPSVFFGYEIGRNNTLQLNYSRRISRPRFRLLLPFYGFSDNRNLFTGNPDLEPEYTNAFEFGNLYNSDHVSLLTTIYYRHRTGVIERITTTSDDGFTRMLPVNLATQDAYGFEGNLSYDLTDSWRFNSNFNFYRAITEGEYAGEDLSSDTYTWTLDLNTRFTLFEKVDVQPSMRYRAPEIIPQGERKEMYSFDIGLSMDILQNNGTLSFTMSDLFDTRRWRREVTGEGFSSELEFQRRSRQMQLNFTYRLNQNKQPQRGGSGGGFDGGEF